MAPDLHQPRSELSFECGSPELVFSAAALCESLEGSSSPPGIRLQEQIGCALASAGFAAAKNKCGTCAEGCSEQLRHTFFASLEDSFHRVQPIKGLTQGLLRQRLHRKAV